MRIGLFTDTYLPDVNGVVSSIVTLQQELEKNGFLVIAGKVPRRYFEKRWYGFSA